MPDFESLVLPWVLILCRVGGLFIYAPIIGSTLMPRQVKALLAASLACVLLPTLLPTIQPHLLTLEDKTLISLAPLLISEVLVGVVIGFAAGLPLIAVEIAGLNIGQQLGLGLAQTFNPDFQMEGNVAGQMIFYLAMIAFVALDGVETLFLVVAGTFVHIPPGGFVIDEEVLGLCLGLLHSAFELSLRIAAPVIGLIFIETFALGFISKTAPAFNIMSLGFPLRVMIGLFAFIATVGVMGDAIYLECAEALDLIAAFFTGPR